jgi:hypothetical protein
MYYCHGGLGALGAKKKPKPKVPKPAPEPKPEPVGPLGAGLPNIVTYAPLLVLGGIAVWFFWRKD